MSVSTHTPAQSPSVPGQPGHRSAPTTQIRSRTRGISLGPLPAANLVILGAGLGIGIPLILAGPKAMPFGIAIAAVGLLLGLLRWSGRWFTQWVGLVWQYTFRSSVRTATWSQQENEADPADAEDTKVTGGDDARVALLRLALPDLHIAHAVDHERRPLGITYHDGGWTAVLQVEPTPSLITNVTASAGLPLGALASCLEDRGVVLDEIQVMWHSYPGSTTLSPSSPALASYLEVLGPLPATARRTTWVGVRLDPRRCPAAVRERGGGVVGAHRALIGAVSRVSRALEARGVNTRPLDVNELLRAGLTAAELTGAPTATDKVSARERWAGVTAAGVGHSTYTITNWPSRGIEYNLNALTGVRALSTTVAMSISHGAEENTVGLRGLLRVSARTPSELTGADQRLKLISKKLGITLTPLSGQQFSGLAATLPLGGNA
ncbi:type VII secretion protein EccE [Pseudonocardiaceae bacterium YIM PH 21723]|nr:type VII secretion protein EccE [Pseudonocardiaceae bacterium YIM PH 21723]